LEPVHARHLLIDDEAVSVVAGVGAEKSTPRKLGLAERTDVVRVALSHSWMTDADG
jgi:hypothetical protein